MQEDSNIQTASLPQPPYFTCAAAYELAAYMERWEVNPDHKVYLATAYIADHGANCWYIMMDTRGEVPPMPSLDAYTFEEDNARNLFTDIAKHFNVGIHCFDGRNFNVTVKGFSEADLRPMLPTLANQRRRKLLLLID